MVILYVYVYLDLTNSYNATIVKNLFKSADQVTTFGTPLLKLLFQRALLFMTVFDTKATLQGPLTTLFDPTESTILG